MDLFIKKKGLESFQMYMYLGIRNDNKQSPIQKGISMMSVMYLDENSSMESKSGGVHSA